MRMTQAEIDAKIKENRARADIMSIETAILQTETKLLEMDRNRATLEDKVEEYKMRLEELKTEQSI